MTDEERQKLCALLREPALSRSGDQDQRVCEQAAAEIERLAGTLQTTLVMYGQQQKRLAALAQSDAEPVAWSWREAQPFYAVPPRPDASQSDAEPVRAFAKAVLHGDDEHKAWLIEAAEAFIAGRPLPLPRGKGTKQSDAEPVAWQWRAKYTNGWSKWTEASEEVAKYNGSQGQCEWRALYAAPPRPDVSAGLIETFRKNAEECYQAYRETHDPAERAAADAYNECADALAADRSGK